MLGNEISKEKKDFSSQEDYSKEFSTKDQNKILIKGGKLLSSNFDEETNDYYELIGQAYNENLLSRAQITNGKKGEAFYTYIVDGQPKIMPHSIENDKKYGYSKTVYGGQPNNLKLFSLGCSKLKFNEGEQRIKECNTATGYFLVHEKDLFKAF